MINPALIPFAVAPLLLIHRSLAVPLLEQEARLDPKTGLFNVRHFSTVLNEKLEHSLRTGQPLALLMIDLDLLREINNTYGHLAGDAILERIADVFRSSLRADDIAARFGGEEFVVLLPDTDFDGCARAGRARSRDDRPPAGQRRGDRRDAVGDGVDRHRHVPARRHRIRATLIHSADLAVYRAKIQGRNRVVDGRVEPIGELAPNSEWWGPKPSARSGRGAAARGGAPLRSPAAVRRPCSTSADERRTAGRDIALQASLAGIVLTALGVGVTLRRTDPPTWSRCWRSPRSSPAARRSRSRPRQAPSPSAPSARSRAPP